jgi:hypothetical protein
MDRRQVILGWVLGSAALMVIGSFGPWVKALGTSVGGTHGSHHGWVVVGAAAIGVALFVLTRAAKVAGLWALLAGAVGAYVTVHDRSNLSDGIGQVGLLGSVAVQIGWGLNVALIASISFAVAGVVWMIIHQPESTAPESAPTAPAG